MKIKNKIGKWLLIAAVGIGLACASAKADVVVSSFAITNVLVSQDSIIGWPTNLTNTAQVGGLSSNVVVTITRKLKGYNSY
jgi:hypothetical protein